MNVTLIIPLLAVILCGWLLVSCSKDHDVLSMVAHAEEKVPALAVAEAPDVVAPDAGTEESASTSGKKEPVTTLSKIYGTERNLKVKNVVWGELDEQATAKQEGSERRASKVKLGDGELGQFCNKSNVRRKVRGRAAALRACYDIQLEAKSDIKGKVTVQWSIDLTGKVIGTEVVENETGDKELEQCITKTISKLHFQKPAAGVCSVRWPFVFTLVNQEER